MQRGEIRPAVGVIRVERREALEALDARRDCRLVAGGGSETKQDALLLGVKREVGVGFG